MIVVDASAVGRFLIPDEADPFADLAREVCARQALHAPAHWPVEIASLLRKARWRGRLTDDQASTAADVAQAIAQNVAIAPPPAVTILLARSIELDLSAYDAGYYLLAETLDAALLIDDGKLRRVAAARGLRLLLP